LFADAGRASLASMPSDEDEAPESVPREDRIYRALLKLTEEVLEIRQVLVPIKRWEHVAIIVASSFLGGVVTNLALWALGFGTIFGLHR